MPSHSSPNLLPGTPDTLCLYPNGYPVYIDVSERELDGAAVAMHFDLPPHGHNFPLKHQHESKLVVALAGQLQIRSGHTILASLARGDCVLLQAGTAHRILQYGQNTARVGVVLWPGRIEHAFRAMAAQVTQQGFDRAAVTALLAEYGVSWDQGFGESTPPRMLPVQPLAHALQKLPPALAAALARCWLESAADPA